MPARAPLSSARCPRSLAAIVASGLSAGLVVACASRPPTAPRSQDTSADSLALASASGAAPADSVPPAASASAIKAGSATPPGPTAVAPPPARPGTVAWLVNPVDHTDAYTLAPDPAGGVFVLGESEVFLGAKDDMFLTRLGADGATVWQTLGVGRNVRHIVLAGEQLFFSTEFSGQVRFGGLSADMTGGATDLFVGKMSLGGAWSWGKVIGTSNYDREGLVAPTADGGVIVAHGAFASARKGPFVFKPQGGEDVLVTRLDASAKHVWTRVIATPGYEEPNALLVDAEGDIYLAGTRWQSRDDWMMALASNPCEGFVTRLSPAGEPTWTTGLGGPAGHTTVSSLTLSSDGTLTVRGTAERAVTIAGAALGPKAGGGLFAKVGKDGQIVAARPSEPAVCLAEHPSGVAFGATKTGIFHEDTSGKRTTIVPFAGEGTAVFRCALGTPGRLYVTGRLSPDGTLGGVRAGKPRVNRSPAWLTTYAVGFVGAIDLLPNSHEDVDSGCRSAFASPKRESSSFAIESHDRTSGQR